MSLLPDSALSSLKVTGLLRANQVVANKITALDGQIGPTGATGATGAQGAQGAQGIGLGPEVKVVVDASPLSVNLPALETTSRVHIYVDPSQISGTLEFELPEPASAGAEYFIEFKEFSCNLQFTPSTGPGAVSAINLATGGPSAGTITATTPSYISIPSSTAAFQSFHLVYDATVGWRFIGLVVNASVTAPP